MKKNWAVVVIDMTRDNVYRAHGGIVENAMNIVPKVQELLSFARAEKKPVIFACDSFLPQDLIFQSRVPLHCLRGTDGVMVIDEICPQANEMILEKRSFSAFCKTDLDLTLRCLGVETIAIAGISTMVCVLMTAFDAIAHGFRVVLLEDCCAAHSSEVHHALLNIYRNSVLHPVLSLCSLFEFKEKMGSN